MDITEQPMGKLEDGAKRFSQNAEQIDHGQQSQGILLLTLMTATGLQEHPSLPPRARSLSLPPNWGALANSQAFGCSSHLSPRLLWGRQGDSTGNLRNHINLCLGPQPLPSFPSDSDGKEYAYNEGDPGSIPRSRRSPGEENGNPLQYSCLENPKDRRVRWVTAQKAAKSQTWLKDQHSLLTSSRLWFFQFMAWGRTTLSLFSYWWWIISLLVFTFFKKLLL